ncbi:hypothetical protein DAEQUDRAFT_766046 [Daedalea quercina L-15889]|uniref:Uncharacterized protein n=1 Tax=Daedalea quercina L-15889 TaxID=1314783 RepID=A0A165Q0F4_9APHY|nr:hypothetical protein DAEQUDRAFT_766046 [Daedalea quercina L-15889]
MSLSSSPESLASPTLPVTPPALAAAHELEVITSEDAVEDSPVCVGQRVRFEADCVLIPDPSPVSRLPRLVTKSYAVPLWRKRNQGQEPSSVSDSEAEVRDDEHVVFKVSVPSIAIRARSPSRSDCIHQPLVPCLVHHYHHFTSDPSTSPSSFAQTPRRPLRAASVPSSSRPIPSAQTVTVPLRPCCPDCVHSTEACLTQGVHWQEKFTRGALRLRRRASSLDARSDFSAHHRLYDTLPGFDSVIGTLAVDEVDKIGKRTGSRLPAIPVVGTHSEGAADGGLLPSLSRNASTSRLLDSARRPSAQSVFHSKVTSTDVERPFFDLPEFAPVAEDLASSLTTPDHGGSRARSVKALGMSAVPPVPQQEAPSKETYFPALEPVRTLTGSPERSPPSPSRPMAASHWSRQSFDDVYNGPPGSQRRPSASQRRPHLHLPAPVSFLKVGAEILKGVTMSAGTPLSV